MRHALTSAAVVALAAGSVALAPPASAGPSPNSSCVAAIFVPQATGEPRAVALRIAEVKPYSDEPWGQVVSDLLAHWDGCRGS